MKVSAVIPTFNRREYIRRAIDSALAQTLPVDEVVVIDDGSTDGTAEAAAAWYGSAVRVVRQANAGPAAARRRGVLEASGDWIAFLDSDDEWMLHKNQVLLDAVARVPADVAWIFGDLRVVTDDGEGRTLFEQHGLTLSCSPQVFADPLIVQFPFQFCMLQSSLIRRNALLELGCFTEGLRSSEDVLAGFQIACRYRMAAIPVAVTNYFRTSDLDETSAELNGRWGPDYFRSRMMAFALVVESGRRRPWTARYASEVRGLCRLLARDGEPVRRLAIQQFRFGMSPISIAFFCAAMLGPSGLRLWEAAAAVSRPLRQLWRARAGASPQKPSVVTQCARQMDAQKTNQRINHA
jgi:glycosyltransferase involved in cell wall biosynthesis